MTVTSKPAPHGSYYLETGKKPSRLGAPQSPAARFSARISWSLLTIKGCRANIWASFFAAWKVGADYENEIPTEWRNKLLAFDKRATNILAQLDSLYADMHEFNRTKSKKQKP